jgi:S-adenosylmethionine-dependent methyltransferase
VLDAGAGTGGYAIALAKQGHHVYLLDFSEDMLKIAQRSVAEADRSLLQRLDFCCFPVEQASKYFPSEHFQVILVHTLLEYLDEPWVMLRSLIGVLAPGGVLSLLVVNPRAEPFRLAWTKKDLARAREALTVSVSEADLFGLPRRMLPPHEIRRALLEAHVDIVSEYGIRIFADHFTTDELADTGFYFALKELEVAASRLEPYKRVARYLHIVGVRQRKASLPSASCA